MQVQDGDYAYIMQSGKEMCICSVADLQKWPTMSQHSHRKIPTNDTPRITLLSPRFGDPIGGEDIPSLTAL